MSLPEKLYVHDLAAKNGRPVREHEIPAKDGSIVMVRCGFQEPGEVPISLAKHFNSPGFRLTEDRAGQKTYAFPTPTTSTDASGAIRLEKGQTIAHYSELKADALADRCKLEGIDTEGMKAKDMLDALLNAEGATGQKAAEEDDGFDPADIELDEDDDGDGDGAIDSDAIIDAAMKD